MATKTALPNILKKRHQINAFLTKIDMMYESQVEIDLKPNLLSSQDWDEIHIVSLCNSTDAGGAPCALCSLTRICKGPPQQGDYLETDKAAAAETANMV